MYCKLVLATLAVIIGNDLATAEQIPSTTTAAEMWNPWTWFWPYAIASAEGYRDYYQKAQKATNELYQQIYKTNAFPWITGNWGGSTQPNQNGGAGGQTKPEGQNTGGDTKPEGQNTGGDTKPEGQNTGGDTKPDGQNTGGDTKPTEPENPAQDNTQNEEKPAGGDGTGAQVEGNVQDDGTADATVKPN